MIRKKICYFIDKENLSWMTYKNKKAVTCMLAVHGEVTTRDKNSTHK